MKHVWAMGIRYGLWAMDHGPGRCSMPVPSPSYSYSPSPYHNHNHVHRGIHVHLGIHVHRGVCIPLPCVSTYQKENGAVQMQSRHESVVRIVSVGSFGVWIRIAHGLDANHLPAALNTGAMSARNA